jgi:uncharacterized protein (DUF2461 family)
MTNGFGGFPPETLRFLRQLKRSNNRDWFLAHKDLYELKVKVTRRLMIRLCARASSTTLWNSAAASQERNLDFTPGFL